MAASRLPTPGFPWLGRYFDLGREVEARVMLSALTADRDAVTPRTCDLLAELFTEQETCPARSTGRRPGSSGA